MRFSMRAFAAAPAMPRRSPRVKSGTAETADRPREFPLCRGSGLQLGRHGVEDLIRRRVVERVAAAIEFVEDREPERRGADIIEGGHALGPYHWTYAAVTMIARATVR